MSLSEANYLIMFVKANRLESSLIIALIVRRIAFDIFKMNPRTRLVHRNLERKIFSLEEDYLE